MNDYGAYCNETSSTSDKEGLQAIEDLPGNPITADIPILAIGLLHTDRLREAAIQAGVDQYFKKPVDPPDLAATIRRFLAADPEDLKRLRTKIRTALFGEGAEPAPLPGKILTVGVSKESIPFDTNTARRESLNKQRQQYQKNLNILEERRAKYGIDPPVSLLNEIDEVKEAIATITMELALLEGKNQSVNKD